MNKQELIEHIAEEVGLSKQKVSSVIDKFTGAVSSALKKGHKVQLVGFGSWQKVKRKAKVGRHPITGKSIPIPPRNVAKFSTGSELLELIN